MIYKIMIKRKSIEKLYKMMDSPNISNKKKLKIFSEIYNRYQMSIYLYKEHQQKLDHKSQSQMKSNTGWELSFERK